MKKFNFNRSVSEMRPFETDALNNDVPGVGGYYFDVSDARVEAQQLREDAGVVTEGTVDLAFLLQTNYGTEEIELVRQLVPGVFASAGYVPASTDGTANLAILDEFANGYAVLLTVIDGDEYRLSMDTEYGQYLPENFLMRAKMVARSQKANRAA